MLWRRPNHLDSIAPQSDRENTEAAQNARGSKTKSGVAEYFFEQPLQSLIKTDVFRLSSSGNRSCPLIPLITRHRNVTWFS